MDQKGWFFKSDTAVFWEGFWRLVLLRSLVLLTYIASLGGKERSLCTLPPTPQTCMPVHTDKHSHSWSAELSLSAPGRVSHSLHGLLPMRGAVSADSGKQTHPCAQPLGAVCFAVAVLVEETVAAHIRCPLLVKCQWSNSCIYVPSESQISHSLRQG